MAFSRPTTKSGHNMFVMASMLQKAIRRGDFERAGYAAYELFGSYDAMLWKRLLVISGEDCWGILTKEITRLQAQHRAVNLGLKGYAKDRSYVSTAVKLLCAAKKSRDACYYACNFILIDNQGTGRQIDPDKVIGLKQRRSFGDMQGNLFATIMDYDQNDELSWLLYDSIKNCDIENSGYAIKALLPEHEDLVWSVLEIAAEDFSQNVLSLEIAAQKNAHEFVNKKKPFEQQDPIFIAKAVMNLMYYCCGKFEDVCSVDCIDPFQPMILNDHEQQFDIAECCLLGGVIPDYVYDVHTIEGKRAGKTDWEMNLVEQAALNPLQPAFFDNGSWAPRYDYKHEHGMCSEKEYVASLEYRKGRLGNSAKKFLNNSENPLD